MEIQFYKNYIRFTNFINLNKTKMKKLILLVCFLLISSMSYSQLLVEDFDYAAFVSKNNR